MIVLFDTELYLPLQYYINDITKMVIFSLDFIAVLGATMRIKDSLEQLKESMLSYQNETVIISTDIKYKNVFKELSTKFVEICNSKIEIYGFTNLEEN